MTREENQLASRGVEEVPPRSAVQSICALIGLRSLLVIFVVSSVSIIALALMTLSFVLDACIGAIG